MSVYKASDLDLPAVPASRWPDYFCLKILQADTLAYFKSSSGSMHFYTVLFLFIYLLHFFVVTLSNSLSWVLLKVSKVTHFASVQQRNIETGSTLFLSFIRHALLCSAQLCSARLCIATTFIGSCAGSRHLHPGTKPNTSLVAYISQTQQSVSSLQTFLLLLASESVVKAVNYSSWNRLHLWLMLCRYVDKK